MPYIGIPPFGQTVRTVTTVTAISSQTIFTPTGGYIVGYVDVYYNGVKLVDGDDYTATNGSTVTLTTAANAGDAIELVSYMPVSLADTYRQAEADSRFVNVTGDTMTGELIIEKSQAARTSIKVRNGDTDGAADAAWDLFTANGSWVGVARRNGGYDVLRPDGNIAHRIDNSGRVTMPYQPCFTAGITDGGGLGSGFTSGQVVPFGNVITNVGGHYSTSTNRFTAPIAGVYEFYSQCSFGNTSVTNQWIAIRLRKNGSIVTPYALGGVATINNNSYDCVTHLVYLSLAAGDYVDVYAEYNTFNGNLGYGEFSGRLVG